MNVAGFEKTSFNDFPGKVASVIFLGGCNMRCYYCHNHQILGTTTDTVPYVECLEKIKEQKSFIDGVVISGGEPTLNPNLRRIIEDIRELGLLVKLDTNGTDPCVLEELVREGLVDYVAMDIKAPIERYEELALIEKNAASERVRKLVLESIHFLKSQDKVPYMFRMTLAPILHESDIKAVADLADGAKIFQIQQFVPNEFSEKHYDEPPHTKEVAEYFATLFKGKVDEVILKGF